MKKIKFIAPLVIFLISAMVGLAIAGTVEINPYGVAIPEFYDYSLSDGKSAYKIDVPTLSEDETLSIVKTNFRPLPIPSWYIDGTGVIGNDGTTAPGIAEHDTIPAITWATTEQSATYRIQRTFRVPTDYSTGLGLAILCSESSETTHSSIEVDIWEHNDATAFNTSEYQCGIMTMADDSSTKDEVLTLPLHSGTADNLVAGDWVTIGLYPLTGSGDTEIKGIEFYYTPN